MSYPPTPAPDASNNLHYSCQQSGVPGVWEENKNPKPYRLLLFLQPHYVPLNVSYINMVGRGGYDMSGNPIPDPPSSDQQPQNRNPLYG